MSLVNQNTEVISYVVFWPFFSFAVSLLALCHALLLLIMLFYCLMIQSGAISDLHVVIIVNEFCLTLYNM